MDCGYFCTRHNGKTGYPYHLFLQQSNTELCFDDLIINGSRNVKLTLTLLSFNSCLKFRTAKKTVRNH